MTYSETIDQVDKEVDGILDAWRSKAASVILAISTVAIFPALLAALSGRIFYLPESLRIICVLLFVIFAVTAIRPNWSLKWRAAVILATIAIFGVIQLTVTHLAGSGRLSLQALPLVALVLLGARAGWLMAALSIVLYIAVAVLGRTEPLAHIFLDGTNPPLSFWLLQGLRLGGCLLMIMALLTRLLALQRRTMVAERTALRKLEAETEDRKRLEAEVARVSEEERRNLGSELHDGLCQNLTAALLNCTALENRRLAVGDLDVKELTRIRKEIEESIDLAYDVAHGLCPVDLKPDGLLPALEDLCHTVRERHGIACELHVSELIAIADPDCTLQLYRIAGEALTNAVKHAECSSILMSLVRGDREIELGVTDNGKGIAENAQEGMGRRIMACRARLLGGSLTTLSAPEQGTTVTCRMPIPESDA